MKNSAFDLILPFLRPIESFIKDDSISEIMINSENECFIERGGRMERVEVTMDETALLTGIRVMARQLGSDISEDYPILDSRLPDGSRVAAVTRPCSIKGTTLTIRKFYARHFHMGDLIRLGTLPATLADTLHDLVARRMNILISGGTGTGKTTLLNILSEFIPEEERIILIEDTSEIQIHKPNLVRWEARHPKTETQKAITPRDLLKAALRHRPDRIVLGEIRGGEAFDWLQALNTGHSGSMSTIHADNAWKALSRLTHCVLQAGMELPYKAIQSTFAGSIHCIIQVERKLVGRNEHRRVVSEVMELKSYDLDTDQFAINYLYKLGMESSALPESSAISLDIAHAGSVG